MDHALYRTVDADHGPDWDAATVWMTIWADSDEGAKSGTDPGATRSVDFDDDGIAEHDLTGAFISLKHYADGAVMRHELGHTFALRHAELYSLYRGDTGARFGESMPSAATSGVSTSHMPTWPAQTPGGPTFLRPIG